MYARLQRLPVEFHDRWQTGQLLSRTTSDLGTIRRFLGFGAIFFVVDALQYLAVMGLLIGTYPPLGVVALLTTLPVIWLAKRFGASYSLISRVGSRTSRGIWPRSPRRPRAACAS